MTTARSEGTSINYDDTSFLALVDRATKGAASDFIATCKPTLEAIRGDAMAKWPVRTGRSRDAFQLSSTVTATEVRANLVNTASYAYFVKFSKWTAADIRTRAHQRVADIIADGGHVTSPAKLESAFLGRMYKAHGKGAPSEAVAGKHAWTLLVRSPAKAALTELLPRLRASMGRLARGD